MFVLLFLFTNKFSSHVMEEVPQNSQYLEPPHPVHLVPYPQLQRTIGKKRMDNFEAASSGLPNMAIYPASEVLHEGAAPPSLATRFTVEPDPILPSITPSPPKPLSPRVHHQHRSNQLAHWRPHPNFSPSISSTFQPFPAQHCYLPNYLQ